MEGSAWTPDEDALLGTADDGAIAKKIGRTRGAVKRRRIKLAIPSANQGVFRKWSKDEIRLLGSDADAVIAKLVGRTIDAVQGRRLNLGIKTPRSKRIPFNWTERRIAKLGTMPDERLAAKLGLSGVAVLYKRRELGILPFGKNRPDCK